ncbi:MAG: large conductance mechanosensitive channel protein MscL [Alphaproteobacteria bacterium CG11_big_fil_rev_8_21_14_0_20_44_7]|nr:MAG: large conductance mechanosensitive channel protein MscL [Alphaproteobacteria bacterium CG11_big_fil_rev_8_21_14_0_20_44_7]
MSIAKEFKEFAMKGNVVDMAVGIIIGAAFGKIVASFVANIVMPPLGLLIGGVDFTDLAYVLKPAEGDAEAVVLAYGAFIQTVFDFVIVAFAIFMAIKAMNSLKKKEEEAPAAPAKPAEDILLLREIRDSLKKSPAAKPKAPAKKKK